MPSFLAGVGQLSLLAKLWDISNPIHYKCVALCFVNIRQKGRFWAASLASGSSMPNEDRSLQTFRIQVDSVASLGVFSSYPAGRKQNSIGVSQLIHSSDMSKRGRIYGRQKICAAYTDNRSLFSSGTSDGRYPMGTGRPGVTWKTNVKTENLLWRGMKWNMRTTNLSGSVTSVCSAWHGTSTRCFSRWRHRWAAAARLFASTDLLSVTRHTLGPLNSTDNYKAIVDITISPPVLPPVVHFEHG